MGASEVKFIIFNKIIKIEYQHHPLHVYWGYTSIWHIQVYGLQVDQDGLELFFISRLSKNSFLQCLTTLLRCFLYRITLFFYLGFIALFFN